MEPTTLIYFLQKELSSALSQNELPIKKIAHTK